MKHTECEDCKLREGNCGHHFEMDGKTNYDIASLCACDKYGNCMFFTPKVKPQGDLISREALKETFAKSSHIKETVSGLDVMEMLAIKEIIDNAQPVEQPVGEWIEIEVKPTPYGGYTCERKCSRCDYTTREYRLNYCPNCGAKMKTGDTNNG